MKRRLSGEGTVSKRKDGRWEAAIYRKTVNGTTKRVRVYGKTRAEASAKLTAQLAEMQRGAVVPDRAWTVSSYIDYWFSEVAPKRLRPKTLETYESVIKVHIKPRVGHCRLTELTVPMLQKVLNQQLADGHSIRVVNATRTVLSSVLTRAMREEIVLRNVARIVELPIAQRKPITPWSIQEAARFLEVAQGHRLFAAYFLLLIYGLRRGEVLGLRWSDIDWDQNVLRVRQQLQQIRGVRVLGPVKTSAGQRDLPLIPTVRAVLRQHRAAADEHHVENDGLLFVNRRQSGLWPLKFVQTFHDLSTEAGLRRIKLHHLRHTTATLLKNRGVPPRDAQLILGHAHISTTQQIYQHGDPIPQRNALGQIGLALLPDTNEGQRSRQLSRHIATEAENVTVSWPQNKRSTSVDLNNFDKRLLQAPVVSSLFTKLIRLTVDPAMTPVCEHLRARLNVHLLGHLAVRNSRQNSAANGASDFAEWAQLRRVLRPVSDDPSDSVAA